MGASGNAFATAPSEKANKHRKLSHAENAMINEVCIGFTEF
jgi:hypothetical protein